MIARVLLLLEVLQTGGIHTVGALAGRLKVDERTVRRYVSHLIELDVPVRTIRGRHGGYRLAAGYRMPPLMLTDEEALAVLLGLIAARRLGLTTSSESAGESAAAKLRRVLPEPTARRLDALLETTDLTATLRPAIGADVSVLVLFAEAARDRCPVTMAYTSRDGRQTTRTLQPYGIVVHSGRWYVTGHDSFRDQVRTFRLDRIVLPRTLPTQFAVPDGFDPTATVLESLAATPWTYDVSVRVQPTLDHLQARLPPGLTTLHDLSDGWIQLHLRVERLDWVSALLASLNRTFTIETTHRPPPSHHLPSRPPPRLRSDFNSASTRCTQFARIVR